MLEAQMIAAVVTVVGMLKMNWPKLSGPLVPVLACIVGVVVALFYGEQLPASGADWLALVKKGVGVGLAAAGGMHAVIVGASKVGESKPMTVNQDLRGADPDKVLSAMRDALPPK